MTTGDLEEACANCSPPRAAVGAIAGVRRCGAPIAVRIGRTLGEGAVGVVHEGRAEDGRAVAVKILKPEHARDRGLVRRFEREIEHALRIDHPHVVAALGAGRLEDGRPFLLMERLEGATLGELVRAEGPVRVARGVRLGAEILAGLDAIHRAGLVHRDLSPSNVFVARDARGERAVILDLGFAQEPGVDAGDGVTVDSRGSLVGTLSVRAPEQATRARAIPAKSDLFAAALLVYFSLSGRIPFDGHDDRDVLVSVMRAAPTPLRRLRRDAPAALDRVFARALAKHPDARFAGAREMRDALVTTGPVALDAA